MKKILVAILVLALVAPAMADVAITASDAGSQQLLISFAGPANAVRGIALTLTVTGGTVDSFISSDFNTFVDYAFNGSLDPYAIGAGHPLALETAAGVIATPIAAGTPFAVSVGYLDQTSNQLGLTSGTVVKLQLAGIPNGGSATVAISANATRGGAVVGDNLGVITVQPSQIVLGPVVTECVKTTAPFYATWVAWGKPSCWCFQKNCRGDIDGLMQLSRPVSNNDLTIFKAAFGKTDAQLALVTNGVCADLDRGAQLSRRVSNNDLTIFKQYFGVANASVPVCDMTNYNFWTN